MLHSQRSSLQAGAGGGECGVPSGGVVAGDVGGHINPLEAVALAVGGGGPGGGVGVDHFVYNDPRNRILEIAGCLGFLQCDALGAVVEATLPRPDDVSARRERPSAIGRDEGGQARGLDRRYPPDGT